MDEATATSPLPSEDISRVILHFDYDCFYCAVFEVENPALRDIPFAVQQKQIIVTCNYEARRRGLHKLQLVTAARRACPDIVIRLGEDLDPFRAASKRCFQLLSDAIWSGRAERLGFDEVWLDVTDMVAFNLPLVDAASPGASFFRLDREDTTRGFSFDAAEYAGKTFPVDAPPPVLNGGASDPWTAQTQVEQLCLVLGSHLARHLRHQLEEALHFTATVGISINKTLSKLVGNTHKPNSQTTLLDAPTPFLDGHDIGRIPGIGFKSSQALREAILGRSPTFDEGLIYGGTHEHVTVADVRTALNAERLTKLLTGPGNPKDLGFKIWQLLHGIDDTPVATARTIPMQISLEDSYLCLDDERAIRGQLLLLATRLVQRLRQELRGSVEAEPNEGTSKSNPEHSTSEANVPTLRWLARPQTLRLTTRPRPPRGPDGQRQRSFKRISRSTPMPGFVCADVAVSMPRTRAGPGTTDAAVPRPVATAGNGTVDALDDAAKVAAKLVTHSLLPLLHALHADRRGLDLSLINVAAVNIVEVGVGRKKGGRDIGGMFARQAQAQGGHALDETEAAEEADPDREMLASEANAPAVPGHSATTDATLRGSEDAPPPASQTTAYGGDEAGWTKDEGEVTSRRHWFEDHREGTNTHHRRRLNDDGSNLASDRPWPDEDGVDVTAKRRWRGDDGEDMDAAMRWLEEDMDVDADHRCSVCGAAMPAFAAEAHARFHEEE